MRPALVHRRRLAVPALFASLGLLAIVGPERAWADSDCAAPVRLDALPMGTHLGITVCPLGSDDRSRAAAQAAADAGLAEVRRLEQLWSTWVPDSDLSRLNRAAGQAAVAVAPETAALLARSRAAAAASQGVFDVTFGPLTEVWRFDTPPEAHAPTRLQRVPTQAEVAARLARVGWRDLEVDVAAGTARLRRPGMQVNVGGIGKGAAVDRVVTSLRQRGFRDFTVQLGGDLYCAGRRGSRAWRVGIAHPRQKGALLGRVEVQDAAFSTSGDYERFAILDGRRYHHLLDLRTGWPAMASQSATVLAPTATDAEVLTKLAFILGAAEGLPAVARASAKAVVVDASGRVHTSPGLVLQPVPGSAP